MKRIEKIPTWLVAAVSALLAGGGLWLTLAWASPHSVALAGGLLSRPGVLGLVFMGGVVIGGLFLHGPAASRAGGSGPGRGGGEWRVPDDPPPPLDPIDLELRRLLDEEATKLR